MGKLQDFINSKMDGKFQWHDLFMPITAGINAITGNDYTVKEKPSLSANGAKNPLNELQDGNIMDYAENAQEATENRVKENPDITLGELVGMEETQFQKDSAEVMYDGIVDGIEKVTEGIDYVTGSNLSESEKIDELKENSPSNKENPKQEVEDKTFDNIENQITSFDDFYKDYLKHIEEREDTAYQRAVADARKAGINPNLMNIQPASTAGSANIGSAQVQGSQNRELEKYLKELDLYITEELKTSEGAKDRLTSLISSVIMLLAFKK